MAFKGGGGSFKPTKRTPAKKPKITRKAKPSGSVPTGDLQDQSALVRQSAAQARGRAERARESVPNPDTRTRSQKQAAAKVSREARSEMVRKGRRIVERREAREDHRNILQKVNDAVESIIPGHDSGGGAFGKVREEHEAGRKKRAAAPSGSAALGPQLAVANLEQANRIVGKGARGAGQFSKNFGEDMVNFPSNAVTSAYYTGKLLKEGKFKEAGQGLIEPYKELAEHPGRTFYEHPFNTALLVSGVKGGIGRGAGRVARSGALGKAAKAAASTTRAPKTLGGTAFEEQRAYSPDVITKGGQVATEKAKRSSSRRIQRRADRAREAGQVEKADRLAEKAARRNPDRVKESELRRRVDETVDANETIRRINRSQVTRAVDKAVPRKASAHVSLTVQGITKASKDDLRAYRAELVREQPSLEGSRLAANKRLVRQIDKALEKGDDARVAAAARAYQEVVQPLQGKLKQHRIVEPGQAERRALMPYAVRNMGAKHDPEIGLYVERKEQPLGDRRVMYHVVRNAAIAADTKVESIRKDGLKPSSNGFVFLYDDLDQAKQFAGGDGRILKVDVSGLDIGGADGAATRSHRGPIPRSRLYEGDRPLAPEGPRRIALTNEQIRAHMRANDVAEPAYVTQAPKSRNGYYINQNEPPSAGRQAFTGEATRKGLFNADRESLREGAARSQGLVDAQEGFGRIVGEFGQRGGSGKLKTYQTRGQAVKRAQELMHRPDGTPNAGAVQMVPVRLNPFAGRQAQLEALLERVDPENAAEHGPIHDALQSALKGEDGPGPWTLIPRPVADQLRQHVRLLAPTTGAKSMQALNSAFRQTVLATSTRWLAGNVIEGVFRAGVAKAGPRSYLTGRKVIKRARQLDPDAAKQLEARTVGGGMYAMQTKMPRRGHEQFQGTKLEPMANALHRFWQTPGPKQVADAWRAYTDVVFRQVNQRAETGIQTAMLGKQLRDSGLMDGNLVKLSKKAVDQAARGALDTNTAVQLGRGIDRMYGRYAKFPPTKRQAVALYTPFIAWSLNALEFIYRTLPRDHPVLSALIVTMEQASEEWRKDHGLDKFMEGRVPPFLQGSIPLADGGKQRAPNRYLPFSVASQGSLATLADNILPQFSSTLLAAQGKDWTGQDRKGDPNDLQNAGAAVMAFLESTVPAYSMTKRAVEEGPNKAFNPFVPSRSKSSSSKKKGVDWGGGGSGVNVDWGSGGTGTNVDWGG